MLTPYLTTGIGSLPHRSAQDACGVVLSSFDIPFWPQLPNLSPKEFMVAQYSEGLPFVRTADDGTVFVERNGSDELERFYESWTDATRIAISEDHAAGLHVFLRTLPGRKYPFLKGHVTGPLTFSLGLRDREGKPAYFDEEFREICLMLLKAKVRWQMDMLKPHAEKVIVFIDEPIFSALGSSAYLAVSSDETLRLLSEVVSTIREAGGLSGIHCCGNADWPLVLRSGTDILNFDSHDYVDTIALYPDEFTRFLGNGGFLAWGCVPTSDTIASASPESVRRRFDAGIQKLSERIPEELLRKHILLTPSCGTGSRTVSEALKVFQLLMRLKEEIS